MALSENDLRVLSSAERSCSAYDGFAPHGAADWLGVRRLVVAGLLEPTEPGICEDCDSALHNAEPTEVALFRLTEAGKLAHETAYESGAV